MVDKGFTDLEFGKHIIDFKGIVLWQVAKTAAQLSEPHSPEDLDIAEYHMRVLKELLRPDGSYIDGISLLNEEYQEKTSLLSADQRKTREFELRIDYAIEHLGILMELLKRKRFAVITRADVIMGRD